MPLLFHIGTCSCVQGAPPLAPYVFRFFFVLHISLYPCAVVLVTSGETFWRVGVAIAHTLRIQRGHFLDNLAVSDFIFLIKCCVKHPKKLPKTVSTTFDPAWSAAMCCHFFWCRRLLQLLEMGVVWRLAATGTSAPGWVAWKCWGGPQNVEEAMLYAMGSMVWMTNNWFNIQNTWTFWTFSSFSSSLLGGKA